MCVLLVLAIVFYKERILFADAAYTSFNIINYQKLNIQEHRYGSFISQIVPYIGQAVHAPIKIIVKIYSIGFYLFYTFVAFVLYRYKQYRLSILLALYYFLFVSASYFWPNNEIHPAIAWMFLLLGLTLHFGGRINVLLLLIPFTLLAFLTIATHMIVIIPLSFLWVYLWIEKKQWPFSTWASLLLSAVLILLCWMKYHFTSANPYDAERMSHAGPLSLQMIGDSFNSSCVIIFFHRCLTNYWVGILLLIGGLVSLCTCKKILLFVFVILSLLGYIVIMGTYYSWWGDSVGSTGLFHIESEWVAITLIVAAPFVFSLLPRLRFRSALIILVSAFAIRLAYIISYAPDFKSRTMFKKEVLAQMKKKHITKLAIIGEQFLLTKDIQSWAMPYESMLMSALNGDRPAATFFFINKDDTAYISRVKKEKGFNNPYGEVVPADINYRYFSIDTMHTYQVMTYAELFN